MGEGKRILFSMEYPETRKITMSTRSTQPLILLILTSILPYLIMHHHILPSAGEI
jgi:hypothetical protein